MTKDMDAETLAALKELLAMVKAGDRSAWVIKSAATLALGGHCDDWVRKAYIGSLDAAKALHDAVLPEWVVNELSIWPAQSICELFGTHDYKGERWHRRQDGIVCARATTPARAWLIAILKARIWEAEQ